MPSLGWLLCCRATPTSFSQASFTTAYTKYAVDSGSDKQSDEVEPGAELLMPSGNEQYLEVESAVSSDDDSGMLNMQLQAALHRRRCRYSGGSSATLATALSTCGMTPANVQHFLRDLSSMHTLNHHSVSALSSMSAQQFMAFKSLWLQATQTNKLGDTETGLTLHEVYLLQHLQEEDHAHWVPDDTAAGETCPTVRTSGTTSRRSSNKSAASKAVSNKADSQADSQADRVDSQQLAEWALFAMPPDCAVPSSRRWEAVMNSTTS